MRKFLAGFVVATALVTATVYARPFPSVQDQLDVDGDCQYTFNDPLTSIKIYIYKGLGTPIPDSLPLCTSHYPSPTPTP